MNHQNKKLLFSQTLVVIYSLAALLFYQFVIFPTQQIYEIRFGADSDTYVSYAESLDYESLISVSANYFGPVVLFRMLQSNLFLVAALNCAVFIWMYFLMQKYYSLNYTKFSLLLLINPMLFMSLATLNKEIFGMASVVLTLCFIKSGKKRLLFLSLIFAVFTRWQQLLVVFTFLAIISKFNPFKKRISAILFLIFFVSIIYPSQAAFLSSAANETATFELQQEKLFGILPVLNQLQDSYMFFIAVIPKTLINFFGNVFRPLDMLTQKIEVDTSDIYNSYIVTGQQASMVLLVFVGGFEFFKKSARVGDLNRWDNRKKISKKFTEKINNELLYCIVYCILFSLGAFIQYRYFFPIYILLCAELCKIENQYINPEK
jgi:hypothetical protein